MLSVYPSVRLKRKISITAEPIGLYSSGNTDTCTTPPPSKYLAEFAFFLNNNFLHSVHNCKTCRESAAERPHRHTAQKWRCNLIFTIC